VRSDILTLNLHVAVRDVSPAQDRLESKGLLRSWAGEPTRQDELLEVAKHGALRLNHIVGDITPTCGVNGKAGCGS